MTIITLSREIGSNGTTIARQVARELGYRFVDKSTFEQVLQEYGLVKFEDFYDSAPGFWARFDSANLQIISMLNKTILGMARLGDVVILGRGGYAALRGYTDVLHVRIQAPFSLRVQHVMEDQGLAADDAASFVAQNDRMRAMFVKGFYESDYYTTRQFHLVLDTAVVPVERAAAWIVEAAKSLSDHQPTDALTTQTIDVDAVLASAISKVLNSDLA